MSISMDNISTLLNTTASQASNSSNGLEKTLNSDLSGATDDELMDVCKEFEAYFLEQVYKEMKKTIPENEDQDASMSQMTDYFEDEMIQKLASQSVEQSGGSNSLAQQLYEGVEIKGSGTVGLITYLRTDSTRISDEADAAARTYIQEQYGAEYVAEKVEANNSGKKIQDAHEAIRPTDISRTPQDVKESLSRDQFRLYQLIWKRFAASRMTPARYETITVKVGAGEYRFNVSTSRIAFEGFRSVYIDSNEEKEETNAMAGKIEPGTELTLQALDCKQHFTQPPAHYTEATLVRTLEELGIGRPSTYAPTITTIIARRYVVKENKNLYMTELGEIVNNIMKDAFPSIVDVNLRRIWSRCWTPSGTARYTGKQS